MPKGKQKGVRNFLKAVQYGVPEQAEMLGEELAKALLAQGAGELLKALYQ